MQSETQFERHRRKRISFLVPDLSFVSFFGLSFGFALPLIHNFSARDSHGRSPVATPATVRKLRRLMAAAGSLSRVTSADTGTKNIDNENANPKGWNIMSSTPSSNPFVREKLPLLLLYRKNWSFRFFFLGEVSFLFFYLRSTSRLYFFERRSVQEDGSH